MYINTFLEEKKIHLLRGNHDLAWEKILLAFHFGIIILKQYFAKFETSLAKAWKIYRGVAKRYKYGNLLNNENNSRSHLNLLDFFRRHWKVYLNKNKYHFTINRLFLITAKEIESKTKRQQMILDSWQQSSTKSRHTIYIYQWYQLEFTPLFFQKNVLPTFFWKTSFALTVLCSVPVDYTIHLCFIDWLNR